MRVILSLKESLSKKRVTQTSAFLNHLSSNCAQSTKQKVLKSNAMYTFLYQFISNAYALVFKS